MSGPYGPYDRDRMQRPGGNSRPNAGQGSGQYGGYGRPNPSSRGRSGYGGDDETLDDGYGRSGPTSRGRSFGSSGEYGSGGYGGYEDRGGYSSYGGGYGQQGFPSQQQGWSPAAPEMYGWVSAAPATYGYDNYGAPPKKSRRKLWITLAVVAALLLVTCGGIGLAFAQYMAPATAAGFFCGNLKVQNYATAYTLLDSTMRLRDTETLFAEANADLDRVEGALTNCKAATGSGAYQYSLGASSATVMLATQRANGGSFQGALHLRSEGGSWKVAAIDPALLGVDLQALVSMDTYCAALQSQHYDAAYALLGQGQQAKQKAADYTQDAQWHDQIDGTISACQVTGIGTGNDASTVTLTVSATRGKSAAHQGPVVLGLEGSDWKIHTGGPEAQGSDLGPAHTGSRFCDDLAKANYADLTTLLSTGFLGGANVDAVASLFSGSYNGVKWTGCTLDMSTYKVSSTAASFNVEVALTEVSSGRTVKGPLLLKFVKQGRDWKVDDFKLL